MKTMRSCPLYSGDVPSGRDLRAIALLATYNERRYVASFIEHFKRHGVETYLIDNRSTDETVPIAERHLGKGLIGIEQQPEATGGHFALERQLRRKEELACELDADWFIHVDADERRLPPHGKGRLVDALADVDRDGYNAVNFLEFAFVPTREEPDHDHAEFERTLRTYYPYAPQIPHRLNAWRATDDVDLVRHGGHIVLFEGLKMYPEYFVAKHYMFLSVPHAVEKYVDHTYDEHETKLGAYRWRARIQAEDVRLPSRADLRWAEPDEALDPSEPWEMHFLDDGQGRAYDPSRVMPTRDP
jgi:glycosyltransferase involved in cell wall biosynthesis